MTIYSQTISELLRERNKARRKWQRNPTSINTLALEQVKTDLKDYTTEDWKHKVRVAAETKGNVWTMVNRRRRGPVSHIPTLIKLVGQKAYSNKDKVETLPGDLTMANRLVPLAPDSPTNIITPQSVAFVKEHSAEVPQDELVTVYDIALSIRKIHP